MRRLSKIYRINNWWYYLGFILLGYVARFKYIDWQVALPLLSGSSLLAYAFSFNDYYDGDIKKRIFVFPLFIFPITIFFLDWFQRIIALIITFGFTLYSHPTTRLKGRPFFSTFSNSVLFSLLFFLGYKTLDIFSSLFFLLLVSLNTPPQLFHEILDEKEDKRKGDITTTVKYGCNFSKKIAEIFFFLASLFSFLLFYFRLANIFFFLSVLFFSIYFYYETKASKIDKKFREKYRRFGILMGVFLLFLLLY